MLKKTIVAFGGVRTCIFDVTAIYVTAEKLEFNTTHEPSMCWIKLVYARRSSVSFIQVTLDRIISVLRSPVCLSVRAW